MNEPMRKTSGSMRVPAHSEAIDICGALRTCLLSSVPLAARPQAKPWEVFMFADGNWFEFKAELTGTRGWSRIGGVTVLLSDVAHEDGSLVEWETVPVAVAEMDAA